MFAKILADENYIKSLQNSATKVISEDRSKLSVLYTTIENFIRDNSFIISNPKLIYNLDVDLTNLTAIVIYCENIFRNANRLCNLICTALEDCEKKNSSDEYYNLIESAVNPRWLSLRTIVAHEELNIFYDGRPIIVFKAVNLYKNIPIFKMLMPVPSKRGIFTEPPILLLPPELELIDIYHKLYSPDKVEEWEDLLSVEFNLFDLFINRKKEIIGSAEKDCAKTIVSNIETIKRLLILDFIKNQPVILIGEWAIKLMEYGETGNVLKDNYEKVQLLIDASIDDFNVLLENFLENITPYKCTYREEKLHSVYDARLKKFTFYISGICAVSGQKTEKPFLDVFNSCRYEIVPYHYSSDFNTSKSKDFPTDIKIGNMYVLLRFFLLDVWILRVIKNLGLIATSILENKITKILHNMTQLKNVRNFNGLAKRVFEYKNYLGVYHSLFLYQKNKISEARFPTYMPFYYKVNNGNYRDI